MPIEYHTMTPLKYYTWPFSIPSVYRIRIAPLKPVSTTDKFGAMMPVYGEIDQLADQDQNP